MAINLETLRTWFPFNIEWCGFHKCPLAWRILHTRSMFTYFPITLMWSCHFPFKCDACHLKEINFLTMIIELLHQIKGWGWLFCQYILEKWTGWWQHHFMSLHLQRQEWHYKSLGTYLKIFTLHNEEPYCITVTK